MFERRKLECFSIIRLREMQLSQCRLLTFREFSSCSRVGGRCSDQFVHSLDHERLPERGGRPATIVRPLTLCYLSVQIPFSVMLSIFQRVFLFQLFLHVFSDYSMPSRKPQMRSNLGTTTFYERRLTINSSSYYLSVDWPRARQLFQKERTQH